jgi:hypothetical protein
VVWNDILAWIDRQTIPSDGAQACRSSLSPVVAARP